MMDILQIQRHDAFFQRIISYIPVDLYRPSKEEEEEEETIASKYHKVIPFLPSLLSLITFFNFFMQLFSIVSFLWLRMNANSSVS